MARVETTPKQTLLDDKASVNRTSDNDLLEPCLSTDCDWQFDLLCAPRPRTRTRLNEDGFFQQDTSRIVEENKNNKVEDICEDWAAVSSYSEEIFQYLYKLEEKFVLPKEFLVHQVEVTYEARAVLVDWLIQVHEFYNFPLDCFYLLISLLDRYMSLHYVPLASFQLLGMSCLLVACKYEDRFVPSHSELINMADNAFTSKQLTNMEKSLLETLNYNLSLPLPSHFLRRLARASCCNAETYTLAKFLLEISTLDSGLVTYKPSLVATSAFCLARSLASESEKLYDSLPGCKYSLDQLRPCVTGIAKVMTMFGNLGCQGVSLKYSRLGINSCVIAYLSHTALITGLLS